MGNKNKGLAGSKQLVILTLFLSWCQGAMAGEIENKIIDKAVDTYGGEKLTQIKSLKYTDNIYHFFAMQSGHALQGAQTSHLSRQQLEITIDFVNQRKVFKGATSRLVGNHDSWNTTVTHQLFSEGKAYAIDHCLQEYRLLGGTNYQNVDRGYSQMLDPLIIKQLDKDRSDSQLIDTANIQGQEHDVLKVTPKNRPGYTLFIQQSTGYLSRMLQQRGEHTRSYDFLDHQQAGGITWARQMFVGTEQGPVYHGNARKLEVELQLGQQFAIPASYQLQQPAEWMDVSALSIRQLAKGVYFVGQDWGYTLFIDVGDYYISAGAWQMDDHSGAWLKGLELLRQTTGKNKPLGRHIVTHHHTDHMSALEDILGLGAKLVVNSTDVAVVKMHLQGQIGDEQIVAVNNGGELANGKVVLFDLPTSHASHNLVLYLPEHRLLFSEDIFGSSFKLGFESPNNWPNLDTYQRLRRLNVKVKQLGLEVEQYVSSHHARVLTQWDINQALKLSCPGQIELKQRLFAE